MRFNCLEGFPPVSAVGEVNPGAITRVFPGEYRDSLFLMKLSNDVSSWPDVDQALIVMGTESNKRILDQLGLLTKQVEHASPHDLIIAARTTRPEAEFLNALEQAMRETDRSSQFEGGFPSLQEALLERRDASLVVLSIPGEHAAALARQALEHDRHVFCFSHHVSLEDEVQLKRLAIERNVLMMGPDCGTAIIDGVGLGFANQVHSGSIGIVSASGSGLQEVLSLIDRRGGGISQAIGVGGRDLSAEVGGLMSAHAIRILMDNELTKVLVILAKNASPGAVQHVLTAAAQAGLPVVADFAQAAPDEQALETNAIFVETFEECACRALEIAGYPKCPPTNIKKEIAHTSEMLLTMKPSRRHLHGLYGGGSLCAEARLILEKSYLSVTTNIDEPLPKNASGHILLDLGSEEYTLGRPHPFIDPRQRGMKLVESWSNPDVAIVLLDIVLGWGCHPNPAGDVAQIINTLRTQSEDSPVVIASVCGTEEDLQCYSRQREILEAAGVLILDSNAQAAGLAVETLRSMEAQNP